MRTPTSYEEFEFQGEDYIVEYDQRSGEILRISFGDDQDADKESSFYPALFKKAEAKIEREAERAYELRMERACADATGAESASYRAQMIDAGRGHLLS